MSEPTQQSGHVEPVRDLTLQGVLAQYITAIKLAPLTQTMFPHNLCIAHGNDNDQPYEQKLLPVDAVLFAELYDEELRGELGFIYLEEGHGRGYVESDLENLASVGFLERITLRGGVTYSLTHKAKNALYDLSFDSYLE